MLNNYMNEDEKFKKLLNNITVSNPEAEFKRQGVDLRSIQYLIQQFEQTFPFTALHAAVVQLLTALANFRDATPPNGYFAETRNMATTDHDLRELLTEMFGAITKAQEKCPTFNEQEQVILLTALGYCRKSIVERMHALPQEDRLLPLWQRSDLKKWAELT